LAEEEDDAQKTEDPTDKKLAKAKEKGQMATSQEVKSFAVLLGAAFGLLILAPGLATNIRLLGFTFIQSPHAFLFDFESLRQVFADVLIELGIILSPLFGGMVVLAIVSNVAQTGLIWSTKKIQPELSKISILKGFKRMFGVRSSVEFVKGILKICLVTIVGVILAAPFLSDITMFAVRDISETLDRILIISIWFFTGSTIVMAVIAALDFAFQKQQMTKQLKMSKQEVKEEHKQSEGDPHVKARIRQIRMERAQQRMMASVPEADVVITNPTHYAVALKYKMDSMQVPMLIAKGMDTLAFKIREVAEENDIPIVENPPLARALHAAVELDEEIPAEHYMAVAEVIGYVMRLRGELPPLSQQGP